VTSTYRVTHATEYRYESEVSASYGEIHLLPRDGPGQRTGSTSVLIDPPPHDLRHRVDIHGNRAGFFTVLTAHRSLVVKTISVVEVEDRTGGAPASTVPWEEARDQLRPGAAAGSSEAVGFVIDSPLVARSSALAELAAPSFTPGRPLVEAMGDLCHRIHADFAYEPGATDVKTVLHEVLARRAGVCQDFAHVYIGCLRSMGLAARYVSGYLETDPPPGREKLQGADQSHAWASVWVPPGGGAGGGATWIDVDPTNDVFVGDRHIVTAWGRDYADVTPLKGVIYTAGGRHQLEVRVDVERL
jgi:transglutaminase-like putative cysteine protease